MHVTSLHCHLIEIKSGPLGARYKKAASGKEQKKIGRLPYLVALSDTRAALEKRAASGVNDAATQWREKAKFNGTRLAPAVPMNCRSGERATWLHTSSRPRHALSGGG